MKNFLKKLASRKFWIALCGFISAICVIFGVKELQIEQICALIGALGTLCAYIIAEGYIDAKSIEQTKEKIEKE